MSHQGFEKVVSLKISDAGVSAKKFKSANKPRSGLAIREGMSSLVAIASGLRGTGFLQR